MPQPIITPLSPVDIPGLQLYITPDTLAPASSGSASGSPVADVTGLCPGTNGTSGNQPVVNFPGLGGRAKFSFNGTSQSLDYGQATSGNLYNMVTQGSFSFAFAFYYDNPSGYNPLFTKSGGSNSRIFFVVDAGIFQRFSALSSAPLIAGTPYVAVYTYQYLTATTGNETLYMNGQLVAQNLNITMPAITNVSFQMGTAQSNFWNHEDIYAICAWNQLLTNSQIMSISNYFLKSMGFIYNLVMDGNSLVNGTGASNASLGHAALLAKMLQASQTLNVGAGGSRFIDLSTTGASAIGQAMISRFRPYQGALVNCPAYATAPACDFNILLAWESTNAFWRDNISVQENINETLAYFQVARQYGYLCGTATGPYMGSAAESKRLQYNAWMRANWGSFADFIVDYGGDQYLNQAGTGGLGATSGYNNYFTTQAPHPNNYGHAKMAQIANRDIVKFIQRRRATLGLS